MSNSNRSDSLAVMGNKIDNINEKVTRIEDKLERDYVTQDQFAPIQKLVYGLVGLILVAVVGAVVALVIRK